MLKTVTLNKQMPLTTGDGWFEAETFCVNFVMWDEEQPVMCCVTAEALRFIGGRLLGFTDQTANGELFKNYRTEIESAARVKYELGNVDANGLLVTSSDLGFPIDRV